MPHDPYIIVADVPIPQVTQYYRIPSLLPGGLNDG